MGNAPVRRTGIRVPVLRIRGNAGRGHTIISMADADGSRALGTSASLDLAAQDGWPRTAVFCLRTRSRLRYRRWCDVRHLQKNVAAVSAGPLRPEQLAASRGLFTRAATNCEDSSDDRSRSPSTDEAPYLSRAPPSAWCQLGPDAASISPRSPPVRPASSCASSMPRVAVKSRDSPCLPDRQHLARFPARAFRRPGNSVRLSGARSVPALGRASLQSGQAAGGSLCDRARRDVTWHPSLNGAEAGNDWVPDAADSADYVPRSRVTDPLRLGRRALAKRPVARHDHLRAARQGFHAAAPRRTRAPARKYLGLAQPVVIDHSSASA